MGFGKWVIWFLWVIVVFVVGADGLDEYIYTQIAIL
jgi:hypothetical protein